MLFKPFKELRDRIGIMKSQNDNIGIGLSCSKEICQKMGGDIRLKQSQKGLTVMAFKLPVKVSYRDLSVNNSSGLKINNSSNLSKSIR